MYDYNIEFIEPNNELTLLEAPPIELIEVLIQGPQGPGKLETVVEGATGWEDLPDGTLWVEYVP